MIVAAGQERVSDSRARENKGSVGDSVIVAAKTA